MHIEKKTLRNVFLGVISCIILYWILHETERFKTVYNVVKNMLSPFIIGAGLAFILNVPMRAFEGWLTGIKKRSLRRTVAVTLTFLAVLLILTLVFVLLIPQLSNTIQSLIPKLETFVLNTGEVLKDFMNEHPELMEWVNKNTELEKLDWSSLVNNAVSVVGNSLSAILGSAVSAIGGITTAVFNAFIAIVFAIYCLFQKETLARQGRKLLYAFFPESFGDNVVRILRLTNSTFSNFLSGQCIEVCILGCMFAVSMAIFRMPYIPLVSVLVAVTAFIPIVGAWIGCVFGAFLILVANPIQAVWFVVLFLVLQQIENNLIYPRVVGTSIGLNGMWVLLAVAVGGELMGVAGMFLMIPVTSVLYTILSEITNKFLESKEIDPDKLKAHPPELRSRLKAKLQKKKTEKRQNDTQEIQEETPKTEEN